MFKQPISKYKNAAPKLIKREQILNGITTNRLSNTIGSLINCSLKHITFALDSSSGGSICSFRHDDLSKRLTFSNDNFCVTHAHSGPITDIQYNTFNQSVLATCGFDSQIQLWSVKDSEKNVPSLVKLDSIASLPLNENRSDCIQWNPNVDNILVSTSLNTIYLWDVSHVSNHFTAIRSHNEAIQGISWKRDGSLICTTAKDKTMQIIDPRNTNPDQNLRIENAKTANKDSKVIWIGTTDCVLSSVYTQSFQREIYLWDIRNPSIPINEYSIDTGNNVLIPYYDYDTSVCFLVGKAETMVRYCEVIMNDQFNFTCNSIQQVDDQIKGVCMMPKIGLDLMKCELDRLLLLTRNSLYPLPYFVPRRSYYDFHSDIYPETYNLNEPGLDKSEWLKGFNTDPIKMALNPENQRKYYHVIGYDNQINATTSINNDSTSQIQITTPSEILNQKLTQAQNPSASVSSLISSMNKIANSNELSISNSTDLSSTSSIKLSQPHNKTIISTTDEISESKPSYVLLRSNINRTDSILNSNSKSSNNNSINHSNGKENSNIAGESNDSNISSASDRKTKAKSG
jgi:coronin-7